MKYSIYALLVATIIFCSVDVYAQRASERIRPKWVSRPPKPSNDTFSYKVISQSANSLSDAKNKCLAELVSNAGFSNGVVVISTNNSNEKLTQKWDNGRLTENIEYNSNTDTEIKGNELEVYINDIDEYWVLNKSGNYLLTKIYAISNNNQIPEFDKTYVTANYGARGLWRSMIIPGWGQFHKGANLKGGLILGGSVALVGGIVFAENTRANYASKILQTHDVHLMKSYMDKRNHFATARNICIGALGALYVYNLIDAIATPGAKYIKVEKTDKRGNLYSFHPSATSEGYPMAVGSIRF